MRGFLAILLCAVAVADDAAERLERSAAKTAPAIAMEFRLLAAQALEARHPEQARRFVEAALELRASPTLIPPLITALARASYTAEALRLYRDARGKGQAQPQHAGDLLVFLVRAKSPEAAEVFQEIAASYSFERMTPNQAWSAIGTAQAAEAVAPEAAAGVYERVLQMASAANYGEEAGERLEGEFQLGSKTVRTSASRDTLLLLAGNSLRKVSPGRAARYQELLSRWDLSSPVRIRSLAFTKPGGEQRTAEAQAIYAGISKFRGLPTDADRGRLAIELAAAVRKLPPDLKLGVAMSLAGRATEGDLGREALTAVARALGEGIQESKGPGVEDYLALATLIRYERIAPPIADPALDGADALLSLRDGLVAETGFTLEGLDGKTYSLAALKGKVVLLNFWATWCPPCRKEMPDMEKLSREFGGMGLVVLAVSDEAKDVVLTYLAKENYSFPILLDPDRKVHIAFHVDGIPKSLLFDRAGRLAAQAIDMRTGAQFREMLKGAGLE